MSKAKSLWQADFIILLRWIIFLPIGFTLTIALQAIPPLGLELVKSNIPESTLLTILFVVLAVPVLLVLGGLWGIGVLMTPYLNCGFIAPTRKIPAVIYGLLFGLFEGIFLVSTLAGGMSWILFFYQLIFSGITVCGIVMLYKGTVLPRFKVWMPRE